MQRTNAVEVMPRAPRFGVSMEARVDGRSEIDVALELLLKGEVFDEHENLCTQSNK